MDPATPTTNQLRARRIAAGFGFNEFMRLVELPSATLRSYEREYDDPKYAAPNLNAALRIARALGASVEELFGSVPPPRKSAEMKRKWQTGQLSTEKIAAARERAA